MMDITTKPIHIDLELKKEIEVNDFINEETLEKDYTFLNSRSLCKFMSIWKHSCKST